MSVPIIAFFNNTGGVGKTTLVYHLAWIYADRGLRVVAADLDPRANLTAAFLDEDEIEPLWSGDRPNATLFQCVRPLLAGRGDVAQPSLVSISDSGQPLGASAPSPAFEPLALIPGDLELSSFEDQLSETWPKCLDRDERAFRVQSALWRIVKSGAAAHEADLVLVDLGPNLGAINRSALIGADYLVVPLSPDLFSIQGLRNLGPKLREWRDGWTDRLAKARPWDFELPEGRMQPIGYVVLQHAIRLDRPARAYHRWAARIPAVYAKDILDQAARSGSSQDDPECLALLRHYRSLMPLAQDARKPVFRLKPADGALGGHQQGVQQAYHDFDLLARRLAARVGIPYPSQGPAELSVAGQ